MASNPTIPPIPPTAFVDPKTGRLTREAYRFLLQLNQKTTDVAGGEVATPAGGGLEGGGLVADGISLSISDNGVSNGMLRQGQPCSVMGRYSNSVGNVGDIVAVGNDTVLGRFGDQLVFQPLSLVPGTVADGDYGDVTVSSAGTVWTIDNGVVTFAKFQDIASDRLVGRDTAGTGVTTEIAVGGGVEFTGGNALQTSAFTGDATKAAGGTVLTLATVNANVGSFGSATQVGQFTVNGKGLITAAANVTITPAASSITGGAALTRVDDTNVTLTLGGTPATSLLAAVSITAGWTGTLAVARGGTGGGSASGTLLDNITGFSSTGHLVRTGSGAYAFRTVTGTANEITVTNGSGVSGNPTISLPTAITGTGKTWTGGTFASLTQLAVGGAVADVVRFNDDGGELVFGSPLTSYFGFNFSVNAVSLANYAMMGNGTDVYISRPSGGAIHFREANGTDQVTVATGGAVTVPGAFTAGSLRINQTATAATPTPTHTFTISLNGTTYRVPCVV